MYTVQCMCIYIKPHYIKIKTIHSYKFQIPFHNILSLTESHLLPYRSFKKVISSFNWQNSNNFKKCLFYFQNYVRTQF